MLLGDVLIFLNINSPYIRARFFHNTFVDIGESVSEKAEHVAMILVSD
jgi:hypothetical protein